MPGRILNKSIHCPQIPGNKARPIVIGENMRDRVIPKAAELGADYYKPRAPVDVEHAFKKQARWINDQMRQGREIIDLGPDPIRTKRSPFYEIERKAIQKRNYPVKKEY